MICHSHVFTLLKTFCNCICFHSLSLVLSQLVNVYRELNEVKKKSPTMKLSFPMPGGGTGLTLFSKLVRTKDLRSVQGEDPRSTKPKLTVNFLLFSKQLNNFKLINNFFYFRFEEMPDNVWFNVAWRWIMLRNRNVSRCWYGSENNSRTRCSS